MPENADLRAVTKWKEIGPLSIEKMLLNSDLENMGVEPDEIEQKSFDLDKGNCIGFYKKGTTQAHGVVRTVLTNGQIFEYFCKNNKQNGYGRQIQANGIYYEGMWKDAMPHGKGKAVYPGGKIEDGNWDHGKF